MENLVNLQSLKETYQNKKVLITGHTGFKGAWLCAWLHQLGATVRGYALQADDHSLFNELESFLAIQYVTADIRDRDRVRREIQEFKPEFIFHLAAQALVRRSYIIPAETFDVNVTGTANVLEAVTALEGKCSVVVVTTDKVYDNKERDILYNEGDSLGGYDPYSASKACTELVVNAFRNSFFNCDHILIHKKAVASARAGNVIGGGDYNEDRIIPDIVRSLKAEKMIPVRNPNSVRPWQHVLEPIGGYLLLGKKLHEDGKLYSGAYNFGPEPTDHLTVEALVKLSIDAWGKGEWGNKHDENQPHEAKLLQLDITKAKDILKWQPKLNAERSISWTMNWYKNKQEIAAYTIQQINDYMNL